MSHVPPQAPTSKQQDALDLLAARGLLDTHKTEMRGPASSQGSQSSRELAKKRSELSTPEAQKEHRVASKQKEALLNRGQAAQKPATAFAAAQALRYAGLRSHEPEGEVAKVAKDMFKTGVQNGLAPDKHPAAASAGGPSAPLLTPAAAASPTSPSASASAQSTQTGPSLG